MKQFTKEEILDKLKNLKQWWLIKVNKDTKINYTTLVSIRTWNRNLSDVDMYFKLNEYFNKNK